MKRSTVLSLLLALMLLFSACNQSDPSDTVAFYYARNPQSQTVPSDTFCTVEHRRITTSNSNLRYLLSLYLQGPLDDGSVSPFPDGTQLVKLDIHNDHLFIQLSQEFAELTNIDLTLACACLSLTCFDLADANQVTIFTSATENYPAVECTMTREDLLLTDAVTWKTSSE